MNNGMKEIFSFGFDFTADHLHIPDGSIHQPVMEFKMDSLVGPGLFHLLLYFFG
jgi:hypothetical protein